MVVINRSKKRDRSYSVRHEKQTQEEVSNNVRKKGHDTNTITNKKIANTIL